mgnify:CR=1 FL=1
MENNKIAIVTGEVKMGTSSKDALSKIRLIMLVNDVSLRNLIPNELAKKMGLNWGYKQPKDCLLYTSDAADE